MSNAEDLVCIMAEGDYFHGAAALCNSLHRHRFAGVVLLGYRGELPDWARALPPAEDGTQRFAPGMLIRFVPIEPGWHLSNLKARFMQRIVQAYPRFNLLYYFDADIVVTCAWENYARWAAYGVVLVLDLAESYMPAEHAFRHEWAALAARAGFVTRPLTGYFNGGCVGVAREHSVFVDVWARLLDELAADGADMTRIVAPLGKLEYAKMDQDVLNAAAMAADVPLALLGTEAMGTFPAAPVMAHAMIGSKPWGRNYVLEALKGFPPDFTHRAYWRYVVGPVTSFPPWVLRRKRLQVILASVIGKLRHRSMRDW